VDSSIVVKNLKNVNEPYILKYNTINKPETNYDKMVISPFLNEYRKDNPLKKQARTLPIDIIYPTKCTFIYIRQKIMLK